MVVVQVANSRAEVFGEWLASRPVGQLMFRGVDSVLRLVEKSLMWSTQPAQASGDASESGAGAGLVIVARPLPWPLFLPLLSLLGFVRVTVYYASRIFRKPQDTRDIIVYLQTKRRRLRAIKYAGIKDMRSQQEESKSVTLRTPTGTPNTKTPAGESPDQEKKRKFCDVEQSDCADSSDDEGVAVKLDKYGEDYDSDSDPDFEPNSDCDSTEDEDSGEGEDDELENEMEVIKKPEDVDSPAALSYGSPVSVKKPEDCISPVSLSYRKSVV